MKRFSEIQKRSRGLRRINEADETPANLPSNYEDMSKEELIALMSGKKGETNTDKESKEKVKMSENDEVSKFISKLLESREMAQVYHWTVKGDMGSHAAHLALQTYYEEVIEFIDDIVEIYQGQYGLIEEYNIIDTTESKSLDKLDYFKEIVETVKLNRKCIKAEDTHIHNIIDELIALQYKTIYKLTYNK